MLLDNILQKKDGSETGFSKVLKKVDRLANPSVTVQAQLPPQQFNPVMLLGIAFAAIWIFSLTKKR